MACTSCKLLLVLAFFAEVGSQEKKPTLLNILIDGFRWDYLDKFEDGELPGFDRLRNMGVKADYLTPVFPTYSYVNYYSLMTGLYPESHGMVHNNMWDPKHREYFLIGTNPEQYEPYWWDDGEPLWITAEKQGLRSYLWYWCGCEVEIRGTRPTFCAAYQNLTSSGGGPTFEEFHDALTEAVTVLVNGSADFAGVYFELLDTRGHSFGPDSEQVLQTVRNIDEEILYVLNTIEEEDTDGVINLMVFGDHGMKAYETDGWIDWWHPAGINLTDIDAHTGHKDVYQLWPMSGKTDEIFEKLNSTKQPNMEVYKNEDILERWHLANHYRTAPILLVADPGYYMLYPGQEEPGTGLTGATHGYDNMIFEIPTIYLATGPAFKSDYETGDLMVVELYQLMCHVLNLTPSVHNGTWSNVQDQLQPEVRLTSSAKTQTFSALLSATIVLQMILPFII